MKKIQIIELLIFLLYLLGLGLIFWISRVIAGNTEKDNLVVLNTIVVMLLFSSNYFNIFGVITSFKGFPVNIPLLSAYWVGIGWYTGLAFTLIVCSLVLSVPFFLLIALHSMLFFCLMAVFLAAAVGTQHAQNVEREESCILDRLTSIRKEFQAIIAVVQKDKIGEEEYSNLLKLSDDIRFIAPVKSLEAHQLEQNILSNVVELNQLVTSPFIEGISNIHKSECSRVMGEY